MGYAELINTLESLPPERRAEVFDFAEFLAARCNQEQRAEASGGERPLAKFLNAPFAVKEPFRPLSRDEIYDRAGLR
jgi:hypothetical protein